MEDRTVAKHLLDQLTEWGCERIYGVIGDANLELLDELAKQDRIRYIACRHETAAALMASAEAKLTGKLAVCMATSGPGIALLLNGLADAYFDRAPVLAVTGQVVTKNMGTGSHQEIDQQRLVQPVVQYSATTVNPEAFPTQLNLAAKTALARGTVAHLSIPKDLWKQTVRSRLFPLPPPDPSVIAYQEEYQTVLKLLEQAGRPVLLAGRGIRNVREEVVRLAEKLTAPIITTMPAKSCVPNDHPLFVGGLGQGGSEAATQLLHEADLCLILGATWWPEDYVPQDLPVIQVDSVSENIGRTHVPKAALVENLGSLLPELVNDVSPNSNPEWEQTIQEKKAAWDLKVAGEIQQIQSPLAPQRVLYAINQQVDPDAVISVDTGDHTLWFERVFHFAEQEILLSGKWRTLGFALPAAIAAKLCAPGPAIGRHCRGRRNLANHCRVEHGGEPAVGADRLCAEKSGICHGAKQNARRRAGNARRRTCSHRLVHGCRRTGGKGLPGGDRSGVGTGHSTGSLRTLCHLGGNRMRSQNGATYQNREIGWNKLGRNAQMLTKCHKYDILLH